MDRTEDYAPNYFLDWAYEEVQRLMKGKGEYTLTARTTLDVPLQKLGEEVIENALEREGRGARVSQGVLVAMDTDGAVRVIVGGRDYGESQFNRATHGQRQPGSSFKPYVYLTAIENGIKPTRVFSDVAPTCGNWSPSNYGGGVSGRSMTLYDALARSVNTIAVRLSLDVGREKVLANAHKLGLTSVRKTCSMALGDSGIAPLDHTAGFAVFANGGKSVKPYAIVELRNTRDEMVYSRERDEPPPVQLFKREDIETLNTMLEKVVSEGTGHAAQLDFTTVGWKDWHHLRTKGRLVCWIYRSICGWRLVWERRLHRHRVRDDRRPSCRADLARLYAGGPYKHGHPENTRTSAASAPNRGATAPFGDQARRSDAGAGGTTTDWRNAWLSHTQNA